MHFEWCEVMTKEIQALEDNLTWDFSDLPLGKTVLGGKWMFKKRLNAQVKVEK